MTKPKTTKQTVILSFETLIALKTLSVKTSKTQGEIMTAAIEQYLRQHGSTTSK
jgi:predicted DNA-binding protein